MASWEIQARLAQPRILPAENSKIKPAHLFLYKHFRQKELREHTMQNTWEKDRPRERIKQHWSPYWWRRKGMTGDDCKIMYYWRQHPHWRCHGECMMSCHTLVRARLHYIIPLSVPSLLDFIKSGVSNPRIFCNFCLLALVLLLNTPEKSLALSFLCLPIKQPKNYSMISQEGDPCQSWTYSVLSASSCMPCAPASTLPSCCPACYTHSTITVPFLNWKVPSRHSLPDADSQVPGRGKNLSTCWLCLC